MPSVALRAMGCALCVVAFGVRAAHAQQPPCPPSRAGQISASAGTLGCPGALTLMDAVALAQKQGVSAEASRQSLAAARARDRAFNARLMPQVSIGGIAANYNHAIIPVLQPNGETQFVSQSQNESSVGL